MSMKKTRALIVLNIVAIILSIIVLVIAFLAGIGVIDRGTTFSNGAIFFAMLINILSNAAMLNRNSKNYNTEKDDT